MTTIEELQKRYPTFSPADWESIRELSQSSWEPVAKLLQQFKRETQEAEKNAQEAKKYAQAADERTAMVLDQQYIAARARQLEAPSEIANICSAGAPSKLRKRLKDANIYFAEMQNDIAECPTLMCEVFDRLKAEMELLAPTQVGPASDEELPYALAYYNAWPRLVSQPSEPMYRLNFCEFMNTLLHHAGYPMVAAPEVPVVEGSTRKCDMTITHEDHVLPLVMMEAKVAIGATNCNPEVQVGAYYAHFVRGQHDRSGKNFSLMGKVHVEACPALLWTCCGEQITIMCGYTLVRDARLFHLIETLGSFKLTQNYVRVGKLFHRLMSATHALHDFRQHKKPNVLCPPPINPRSVVSCVPGKLVYHCNDAYYKFARSYCESAHRRASELGIAPQIHECTLMENGYYFLKMDVVRAVADRWNQQHWEHFQTQMGIFHEQYVHGDIRPPNVLHTATGYMLIDFDWAGSLDKPPHYPVGRNHEEIDWPLDSIPGGIITVSHDQWMMDQLYEAISE